MIHKSAIRRKFNLKAGSLFCVPNDYAELHITGSGAQTYLWIGDQICYATISGKKSLESLAFNILKALGKSTRAAKKK